MKKLLIVILFNTQFVFAGIVGNIEITGKLLKHDQHTVTLYHDSKIITLPKKYKVLYSRYNQDDNTEKTTKFKIGKTVTVVFSSKEIMEKIREQKILQEKLL